MAGDVHDRPKPAGLGQFFFNELRQAIQDIRQKVVEQGWFGRVTTPKPVIEMPFQTVENNASAHELDRGRRLSFEELWAPTSNDRERANAPSLDHDR